MAHHSGDIEIEMEPMGEQNPKSESPKKPSADVLEVEVEEDNTPSRATSEDAPRRSEDFRRSKLVLHNVAWKSWLPALFGALVLIVAGILLIFFSSETWTTAHWIVSLVFIINGVILALMAKKETYIFNRRKGKLIIKSISIRGRKTKEYWLISIKEVIVQEYRDPQVCFPLKIVIFNIQTQLKTYND
jgi:hypothetical protein